MTEERKKTTPLAAIISVAVIVFLGWFYFGGGLQQQAQKDLGKIENQVAADAVRQYEIAKRNGTPMDACVQAGMVVAAYLQAKDEASYKQWKGIEQSDCKLAGVDH